MKDLINRAIAYYLAAISFLIAVMAALIVIARYANYVPVLLIVVLAIAAAYRWARGDWG